MMKNNSEYQEIEHKDKKSLIPNLLIELDIEIKHDIQELMKELKKSRD